MLLNDSYSFMILSDFFSHDLCEKTLRWEWKNIEESFLVFIFIWWQALSCSKEKFVACHFFRAHKAFIFLFSFLQKKWGSRGLGCQKDEFLFCLCSFNFFRFHFNFFIQTICCFLLTNTQTNSKKKLFQIRLSSFLLMSFASFLVPKSALYRLKNKEGKESERCVGGKFQYKQLTRNFIKWLDFVKSGVEIQFSKDKHTLIMS